jgi:hypothetical protein
MAANTAMFGALMQAGNLGLPRRLTATPSRWPLLRNQAHPRNLEILEPGAQAVKVLEMVAKSEDRGPSGVGWTFTI